MVISDRIRYLIDQHYNGNVASFARAIDVNPRTLNSYFDKKSVKPSFDVLQNIVLKTGCNAHWLLTGEGDPMSGQQELSQESLKPIVEEPDLPTIQKELTSIKQQMLNQNDTLEYLVECCNKIADDDMSNKLEKIINEFHITKKILVDTHKIFVEKSGLDVDEVVSKIEDSSDVSEETKDLFKQLAKKTKK